MGANYWPYGIEANRSAISAMVRYAHEQGLTDRELAIEELFVVGSDQGAKV
jgi:4,5-dihydroxyphthalate decarboxylase